MIKVIQACTFEKPEYSDLVKASQKFIINYCYKNNYEYRMVNLSTDTQYLNTRPASWGKVQILYEEFNNKDIKYVLWADTDTLLINQNLKIESLLTDKEIYLSKDANGINLGIFIIKNSRNTRRILSKMWSSTNYINHPWWEQAALIDLIDKNYENIQEKIEYIDGSILNAYDPEYYPTYPNIVTKDSLFLHTPALPPHVRLQSINKHIQEYSLNG